MSLASIMAAAELAVAESARRHLPPRKRPETFADFDRASVADILSAFTAPPESDIDRFDALARLGIDVSRSEELAMLGREHLLLGWDVERSARVLRGRVAGKGEAA